MLAISDMKTVWLASYPRSGSTYFRILLNRIYGAEHSSIYEGEKKPSIDIDSINRRDYLDYQSFRNLSEYRFVKTHELPDDHLPALYLVRDGRDALVSYAWYILEVEKVTSDFHGILKDLILNPGFFGGWANHVLSWTGRPAMTSIVRFEDIVHLSNPETVVSKALEQLKFRIPDNSNMKRIPSFEELRRHSPLDFRKGKIGSWTLEMPEDLHDLFWDMHGKGMERAGYAYKQSKI